MGYTIHPGYTIGPFFAPLANFALLWQSLGWFLDSGFYQNELLATMAFSEN
jgi:hypothetical protein